MNSKTLPRIVLLTISVALSACATQSGRSVNLTLGVDESAGGGPAYIISTPGAVYFLEKEGGGLSSIVDADGVDWLGFHNEKGSGWKGEYRGFPNAIHRQDGDYFHAMNGGTDPSSSVVDFDTGQHVRITFTSDNGQWQGQWDFYPDRCDFFMKKISAGHHYWIQYEGVPGGQMDPTDFRYSSADNQKHPIEESFIGDLPAPEWMAFGDQNSPRVLYLLHHTDDSHPDDYVSRPYMTVLGFGRRDKNKFLDTPQRFSIGFIETTDYSTVDRSIRQSLDSLTR